MLTIKLLNQKNSLMESKHNRVLPLAQALGAAKDKTNEFLQIKQKITLIRDPAKR